MARLRLNQEYRNKISNRMRVHLESENTQELLIGGILDIIVEKNEEVQSKF